MSTRSKAAAAAPESDEKTSPKKKRGRPAKAKAVAEPVVMEKTEDDDTDVDESTAQIDADKMDTSSETKPQDEPKPTVTTGDQQNGVTTTEDSSTEKTDTEEKTGDVDSDDKEKSEDKKDVVVIDDEEEEPESEEEIVEDRDDGGEDPSEVEIEQFNMPLEQALLSDLNDLRCRRRLVVYPLKMSELCHPTLMEAITMATEFKTSYVKSHVPGSADSMIWTGYMELVMKSTIIASDCMQSLKTIREDLNVRMMEPGENPQKLVQSSSAEFVDADSKLFTNIILARPLSENTTVATMKDLFPGAMEIAFPRQVLGARMAYIIYEDSTAMNVAFDKLAKDPPTLDNKQLRLMKYDTTVEWPTGLLRLKRRYRVQLQMNRLRKAIKDPQNGRYMDTMKSTVAHCKSLIEKDDAIRKELGFEVPSFSDLRHYKRIRESVNEDAIWLPGKRMGGLLDRRSFVDEDEDDEKYRRNRRGRGIGESAGIPSLMSVDPHFNPVARAQVIAHQIARMAVAAPSQPLLRGGPPFGGPRPLMRGPRPMRGGPMGGFPGSRGGFHGDGPPHDHMMGWRGPRGGGFGRGSFGRGRGDFRGDDGGGYGGRGGRFGGEGFGKRPRSPPPQRGGGAFRGGRESSNESAPFNKMSRGDRDSARGRPDQRGGRGGTTASGGFQQNRGAAAGTASRWNKPTGDNQGTGYGYSSTSTSTTAATSTAAAAAGYNAPSSTSSYKQAASTSTGTGTGGYSAGVTQTTYGQQQSYQQPQMTSYNTPPAAAAAASVQYGQTTGYQTQQPTGGYPTQQAPVNTGYTQQPNTAYMQGAAAYGSAAAVPTGYAQPDASSTAYSQTQNVYAGYTQPTGNEYYQTAAGSYQQAATAQQTAMTQGWPQQQYWPTQQQAAAWPTTADTSGQTQVADANAAAAAYAAAYNWPTGWTTK